MKYIYKLEGLECANCAAKIERAVGKLKGVKNAEISFLSAKLFFDADESAITDIELQTTKIIKRHEPHIILKKA